MYLFSQTVKILPNSGLFDHDKFNKGELYNQSAVQYDNVIKSKKHIRF